MSRYVVDAVKGTVLDPDSGLTWQRESPANGFTSLAAAEAYAASLTLDGGGWRIPMQHELLDLMEYWRIMPSIDIDAFPNCPSDLFWTAPADEKGYCWLVDFRMGGPASYGTVDVAYVRCVR